MLAQPEGEYPQVYVWTTPPDPVADPYDPNFTALVRVFVGDRSGAGAANAVFDAILARLAAGTLEPDRIAILMQNWAHLQWAMEGPNGCPKLFTTDDQVTPLPDWNDQLHASADPRRQPWMTQSRLRLRAWMDAFVAQWNIREAALPPEQRFTPFAFIMDTEEEGAPCCNLNHTRLMRGVATDARWNDVNTPLPGHPAGTTMQSLFEAAQAEYQWPAGSFLTLVSSGSLPNQALVQPYYLWYRRVMDRCVDAVFLYALADPIHQRWPGCIVSNYEHYFADGSDDEFGWFEDIPADNSPVWTPATQYVRGGISRSREGSLQHHRSSGRFDSRVRVNSLDRDAPVLYDIVAPANGLTGHQQHRIYLPNHPLESPHQSAMRINRMTIESCINSGDGGRHGLLWPWVPFMNALKEHTPGGRFGALEIGDILAMLRAKKTEVLPVWTELQDDGTYLDWSGFKEVFWQVYRPRLVSYKTIRGTDVTSPPAADWPEPLWYTLRVDNEDQVVTIHADQYRVCELIVEFADVGSIPGLVNLVLNLEGHVDAAGVLGSISVWNTLSGNWVAFNIPDVQGSDEFVFATPTTGPVSIRRRFSRGWNPAFLDPNDQLVRIKVVLRHPDPNVPFSAKWDLIQLMADSAQIPGGVDEVPPPSDFSYNGIVDTEDVIGFANAYVDGAPAADRNLDGEIDLDDLIEFMEGVQP